jgi:hypothetical protein
MGGGFSGSGHLTSFNTTIRVKDTDEIFATFPVPEIQFSNGASFDIDHDLDLSCVECLSSLATSAASSKNSSLLVEGAPDLKFGDLPTAHLNIHKVMNVNGECLLSIVCLKSELTSLDQVIMLQVRAGRFIHLIGILVF